MNKWTNGSILLGILSLVCGVTITAAPAIAQQPGGGHPPLLLQQIPDLEHGFHTPASLGES